MHEIPDPVRDCGETGVNVRGEREEVEVNQRQVNHEMLLREKNRREAPEQVIGTYAPMGIDFHHVQVEPRARMGCVASHLRHAWTSLSVEGLVPCEEERSPAWQNRTCMIGVDVTTVPGKVDGCDVIGETVGDDRMAIAPGALLVASGWIISAESPFEQIWISIDGVRCAPCSKGYERKDVAEIYDRPDARFCGFRAILTVDGLSLGRHTLTVEAIDTDGQFLRADGDPYEFEIVAGRSADAAMARVEVVRVDGVEVDPQVPIAIDPDSVVSLSGWAVSADGRSGVAAFLRGDCLIPLGYGLERPDVAATFGDGALASGFEGAIDASTVASAGNRLEVVLISHDARKLLASDAELEIEVVERIAPRRTLRLKNA